MNQIGENSKVGNLVDFRRCDVQPLEWRFDWFLNKREADVHQQILGNVKVSQPRKIQNLRHHKPQAVFRQVQRFKLCELCERSRLDLDNHVVEEVKKFQVSVVGEGFDIQISYSIAR